MVRDVVFLDKENMRRITGDDIGMVFQEPMPSLNPVFTIGDQIAEPIRIQRGTHSWTRISSPSASNSAIRTPLSTSC